MATLRLCVLGDSLTAGTGDAAYLGWPGRVGAAERRRGHDLTLYNLGIRADTSELIARRWRAECAARLPDAFAGALVFAFGVNDTARETDGRPRVPPDASLELARAMVGAAAAWRPTLWLGPAPVDEAMSPIGIPGQPPRDFRNDRIKALSDAYASCAESLSVPYLDAFAPLSADGRWLAALKAGDGVHPAGAGYALLAELVGAWPAWRARPL